MKKHRDHCYTLNIPLAFVPDNGVMAVVIYTQPLKGGRVRIYRDEIRRRGRHHEEQARVSKIKYNNHLEAVADLPRILRAVACELIATLLQAPWETSWSKALQNDAVHPFEQIGFWTDQVRGERLNASQLESVCKLFYEVPDLGESERTVILGYLEQHHHTDTGFTPATKERLPPRSCSPTHCIVRDALNKPRGLGLDWSSRVADVFDVVVQTRLCAEADLPSRPPPSGRLISPDVEARACPGLVLLETTLHTEVELMWDAFFSDVAFIKNYRAIGERAALHAWLRASTADTVRTLLLMGASGADVSLLEQVSCEGIIRIEAELARIYDD